MNRIEKKIRHLNRGPEATDGESHDSEDSEYNQSTGKKQKKKLGVVFGPKNPATPGIASKLSRSAGAAPEEAAPRKPSVRHTAGYTAAGTPGAWLLFWPLFDDSHWTWQLPRRRCQTQD